MITSSWSQTSLPETHSAASAPDELARPGRLWLPLRIQKLGDAAEERDLVGQVPFATQRDSTSACSRSTAPVNP
jgi:hypothetical protein